MSGVVIGCMLLDVETRGSSARRLLAKPGIAAPFMLRSSSQAISLLTGSPPYVDSFRGLSATLDSVALTAVQNSTLGQGLES